MNYIKFGEAKELFHKKLLEAHAQANTTRINLRTEQAALRKIQNPTSTQSLRLSALAKAIPKADGKYWNLHRKLAACFPEDPTYS
jgi:hypothetical protein